MPKIWVIFSTPSRRSILHQDNPQKTNIFRILHSSTWWLWECLACEHHASLSLMVSRDNIVFTLYVFTYTGIDFSVHMDGYRMYVKYVNFSVWGVPTLLFLPWLNWLNSIINKHCKLRTRQQQILSLYENFRHLAYCANIIPRSSRIHCNGCHLSTSTLPWNVLLTRWIVLMPSNIVDGKMKRSWHNVRAPMWMGVHSPHIGHGCPWCNIGCIDFILKMSMLLISQILYYIFLTPPRGSWM